ncbi:MAG: hypothetical protein HC814_04780 [Rhodobacteraceae bacterium]|nr:hypothetical protein [Paracoccaceae bacterium]
MKKSPLKQEWTTVKLGDRTIHCVVASPEKSGKATTVVLVHGDRGLSDWTLLQADHLAADGYLVVVPDLLSGLAPGGASQPISKPRKTQRTSV